MCLYPKLIKNRKYIPNKKNGGNVPTVFDERVKYVPIGCQRCQECKKQKSREWQVRLLEEIRHDRTGIFITLTFSNQSIRELHDKLLNDGWSNLKGYNLDNQIAIKALRLFLERWRKKFKKSVKHWFVTELGHEGTENIHIHGIIWTNKSDHIRNIWNYGHVWMGREENGRIINYVNEQTIGYIVKYINKQDLKHKYYTPKILTSPGIGKQFINRPDKNKNNYKGQDTIETYKTRTGHKMSLPIYWRNQIYTEDEREKLWLNKLDKQERWIMGEKVDVSNGYEEYNKLLKFHQERSNKLGYGNDKINWNDKQYEEERRELLIKDRIKNARTKIR